MKLSVYSWWVGVLCSPLLALFGGVVVVWLTQDLAVGVIAGIAGLAVGLVVGFVIAAWLERDEQGSEEFATDDEDEWPWPIATLFLLAIFFGGPVAALLATFVVGWLLDG